MNWMPINKILAGVVAGAITYFAQKLWKTEPVAVAQLAPYAVAMVMAYLVKLENKYLQNLP